MFTIISLNTSTHSKFAIHAVKVAIASAIIALIAGLLAYNLMGCPGSFLPTTPSAGYIISGLALLFLVDTVRYALLYIKFRLVTFPSGSTTITHPSSPHLLSEQGMLTTKSLATHTASAFPDSSLTSSSGSLVTTSFAISPTAAVYATTDKTDTVLEIVHPIRVLYDTSKPMDVTIALKIVTNFCAEMEDKGESKLAFREQENTVFIDYTEKNVTITVPLSHFFASIPWKDLTLNINPQTSLKALQDYSEGGRYVYINSLLRFGRLDAGFGRLDDYVKPTLYEAIHIAYFLKTVQSETLTKGIRPSMPLYRSTKIPFKYFTTHQVGNIIMDGGFWSTSTKPKHYFSGCGEYGHTQVHYVIEKSISGVNIASFSKCPHEFEILFPPLTKFIIKSMFEKTDSLIAHQNGFYITVEEISTDTIVHR